MYVRLSVVTAHQNRFAARQTANHSRVETQKLPFPRVDDALEQLLAFLRPAHILSCANSLVNMEIFGFLDEPFDAHSVFENDCTRPHEVEQGSESLGVAVCVRVYVCTYVCMYE
jgi:hypothetical protein